MPVAIFVHFVVENKKAKETDMQREMNDPQYIYADILIALALADDAVDERERDLLNGIFEKMGLDDQTVQQMWLTPRTLDVIESILADITEETFKRCLLKDCYLVAYADEEVNPEEHHFVRRIAEVLKLDAETTDRIRAWVNTAVAQRKEAMELFGGAAE